MTAPSASTPTSDNTAVWAAPVTPSDATVLKATKRLFIGGAGNVAVVMAGEQDGATAVTFTAVAAGAILDISVVKVMATNTTATAIVALW